MRILYHHRTLADGAEGIHIAEMVAAFRSLGHEVQVLGPLARTANDAATGPLARLRRTLPEAANEVAGVAVSALEYRAVSRAIVALRPDMLYKRHARNDVGALAAARARRVPSVLELNCLYSSPSYLRFEPLMFRRLATRLERRALTLATTVIAVSSPLAVAARALGGGTVAVLPNAANPATFVPAGERPTDARIRLGLADRMTLGWTGIVRDWHGLGLLLDVLRAQPQLQLLVVGDGPGRSTLETRARDLDVSDRVTITGRLPHAAVASYLAAIDIAVVADERTGVASPMKLLEYMAVGLPVVAPDVPNIRDLVQPGVTGVLFRPGDGEALCSSVATLVRDPSFRQQLGRNARLDVERERNWKRNAERVVALVADAAATNPAATRSLKGQHV